MQTYCENNRENTEQERLAKVREIETVERDSTSIFRQGLLDAIPLRITGS